MVSTSVIHVNYGTTHLPTPKGWKAELASWLTHSGQCTHQVVISQPQIRQSGRGSPAATDQHPNQAMPPSSILCSVYAEIVLLLFI